MRLCVFCGSKHGNRPEYAAAAREVGRVLADKRIGLVYGGGHVGLMGVLADAVLHSGGEVAGVIPQAMVASELAHAALTELHVVRTMHERKALMAEKAAGFLALPGGFGTAEEFFEVTTWAQLRLHAKPIGLLNVAGYFDPLLGWMERIFAEGFASPRQRELIQVASKPGELIERLCRLAAVSDQQARLEES
jgi:hypothetical protein